jgi:peptidoglycan/xylan/chitin deacetylase (PgdA/CDA1 family)
MAEPSIVFLMYHELELPRRPLCRSEAGYVRYILPQATFSSQMRWLRQNNWHGLSASEALHYPIGKSVAITFDDGSETDLLTAAPILKVNGLNATFYITAGFIGERGYLSADQLRELTSFGFEIGCHSMTHPYLNGLEKSQLRREISDAGKKLEDVIGRRIEHFSCPGGRYDANALEVAKEAGYRSVATSQVRANFPSTDPFALGRVAIVRDCDDSTFQRICTGEALPRIRLLQSVQATARNLLGNARYDRFRARLLHEP